MNASIAPESSTTTAKKAASARPSSLSLSHPIDSIILLLTDPAHFTTLATLLLLNECVLCWTIINFVPYTEIDFQAYISQAATFLSGERDYSLLKGSTGPIVYPAGHLYFYSGLYYLTDKGKDVKFAQYVFAQIYVLTLGIVFAIYKRCGSLPPYALIIITLSKRLHSIYVLRLFNDGVAMLFLYAAILAYIHPRQSKWVLGSVLFSVALSIKMNILLFVPGLVFLLYTTLGLVPTILHALIIALTQVLLALPFLSSFQLASIYYSTAFNFQREFLWEWTVNWRWLGIEAFESKEFRSALLILNVVILVAFGVNWSERDGGVVELVLRGLRHPRRGASEWRMSPDGFVTILFSSNLVGIICARSLHYQFYAWYAHQVVFMAWHTPFDALQALGLCAAIEYGWNVFPSTLNSSMGLTFANIFLAVGTFYGSPLGVHKVRRKVEYAKGAESQKSKVE